MPMCCAPHSLACSGTTLPLRVATVYSPCAVSRPLHRPQRVRCRVENTATGPSHDALSCPSLLRCMLWPRPIPTGCLKCTCPKEVRCASRSMPCPWRHDLIPRLSLSVSAAVEASHHEARCTDGGVAPHGFAPLMSSDLG